MMKPNKKAAAPRAELEHKDLLAGFVRLHVLHHGAQHDVYGQWMIEELAEHGYRLSAGTLYPMLHGMERRGYLTSTLERRGRTRRRVYRITELGREALQMAKRRLGALLDEVSDREPAAPRRPSRR